MSEVLIKKIKLKEDKLKAFEIRKQVFVIEQNVNADEEYDDEDEISTHFIAYFNQIPCGTARWRFKEKGIIKLERFAVLKEFRDKGIGAALVKAVLEDLPLASKVMMHAQLHAIPFYEKQGFEKYGNLFLEAGIEHYAMKLK